MELAKARLICAEATARPSRDETKVRPNAVAHAAGEVARDMTCEVGNG
jgi:hypothetical protein